MLTKFKLSQNSPRENLQQRLRNCRHPMKSFLFEALMIVVIITVVVLKFISLSSSSFSVATVTLYILSLLAILVIGYKSHLKTLYSDLSTSLYQFHRDNTNFLKKYGERMEEVIDKFTLFYEDGSDILVQFHYNGEQRHISMFRIGLPQSYANQHLVVIARHHNISDERLVEYHNLFDMRDLAIDYRDILQKLQLTESTFISESDIAKLSEIPNRQLVTFHLALISNPNESEV